MYIYFKVVLFLIWKDALHLYRPPVDFGGNRKNPCQLKPMLQTKLMLQMCFLSSLCCVALADAALELLKILPLRLFSFESKYF